MRMVFAFGLLIVLAGCSGGPAAYGITGPAATQPVVAAQPAETPDTAPVPGVSTSGTSFGPSTGPATGNSGFWGYNN
jgi:multidrug efflux pump subunit AcrA (membrane-fusion protein)